MEEATEHNINLNFDNGEEKMILRTDNHVKKYRQRTVVNHV